MSEDFVTVNADTSTSYTHNMHYGKHGLHKKHLTMFFVNK